MSYGDDNAHEKRPAGDDHGMQGGSREVRRVLPPPVSSNLRSIISDANPILLSIYQQFTAIFFQRSITQ